MFERLTEKAIKVIMLAQEEARRLGHNFVGTEQILLGLIGEGTGIAAKTLKSMGVNLKDARVEVEKTIGRGSGFVAVEIPFTPRAKRVLELSWDEARQLGHNYIGTEHLLLGLIREGEGVAARVLENLGIDLTKVRSHTIRLLGEEGVSIAETSPSSKKFITNVSPSIQDQLTTLAANYEAAIIKINEILKTETTDLKAENENLRKQLTEVMEINNNFKSVCEELELLVKMYQSTVTVLLHEIARRLE